VRVPEHVLRSAVVFDGAHLLYVPVPKAGSTTLLWALAEAAGLEASSFARSRKLEVTPALTIHDMTVWGSHCLATRKPKEVERILESDEWLRLTVAREPLRRMWSGWVSKILVRDPRFDDVVPPQTFSSAREVLDGFRSFVRELPGQPAWQDPHWSPQADLIGELSYGHIGRVEELDRTVTVLEERVGKLPELRRENPSIIPYSPGVFDGAALAAALDWTAGDRAAFGYQAPSEAVEPDDAWHTTVAAVLPAVEAVAERNARIAGLRLLLKL
jgi:hypothetical protein